MVLHVHTKTIQNIDTWSIRWLQDTKAASARARGDLFFEDTACGPRLRGSWKNSVTMIT